MAGPDAGQGQQAGKRLLVRKMKRGQFTRDVNLLFMRGLLLAYLPTSRTFIVPAVLAPPHRPRGVARRRSVVSSSRCCAGGPRRERAKAS